MPPRPLALAIPTREDRAGNPFLNTVNRSPEHPWFTIVDQGGDVTQVYLYDEIGWFGTTAQDFLMQVKRITSPAIELHINSPGGDVFDAIAIYNILCTHPSSVNVIIDGVAASAASFIAMAGDSILIQGSAYMMIHDAAAMCIGDAQEMSAMADLLDKLSAGISDIYSQRCGGTSQEWRQRMRDTTWFTADEAVAAGLADDLCAPRPPADGAPQVSDWRSLMPPTTPQERPRGHDSDILTRNLTALREVLTCRE